MGAMFDYLDAEEGGAEDMIKHALGEVIELTTRFAARQVVPKRSSLRRGRGCRLLRFFCMSMGTRTIKSAIGGIAEAAGR